MTRKEIFQHEIKTGATITEIKIYTNSLLLIIAANGWSTDILTEIERENLRKEVKDLQTKIKIYEKMVKN